MKKRLKNPNPAAFTLTELIIVMVIAATIIGLAITSFVKTVECTRHDTTRANLIAICSAARMDAVKAGGVAVAGMNLADINSGFGLSIVDSNFTYASFTPGGEYEVDATRNIASGQYTLNVNCNNAITSTNPSCSPVANCP